MLQKHIGITNLGTRVAVVNWKLPNTEYALIVETESLPPRYQDAFIRLLQDSQQTNEKLDSLLHRNVFPSGENMLQALHSHGHLHKVLIDNIQLFVDTAGKKMQLKDIVDASEGKPVKVEDVDIGAAVAAVEAANAPDVPEPQPQPTPAVFEGATESVIAEKPTSSNADMVSILTDISTRLASLQTQVDKMNEPKKRGRPPKAPVDAK